MSSEAEETPTADLDEWLQTVSYQESKTVEKLTEHIFLAEVLQECWFRRRKPVEVLRSEVDASGYDLVLEVDGTIRHVQLKASRMGAKTIRQTINSKLQERAGGCIVWLFYELDPRTWRVELSYLWRDLEVEPLPEKVRSSYTRRKAKAQDAGDYERQLPSRGRHVGPGRAPVPRYREGCLAELASPERGKHSSSYDSLHGATHKRLI